MNDVTERTTVFTAPRGGVMTREAGVITGELELATDAAADGTLSLRIRYAGAAEWYTVDGGPFRLHDRVVFRREGDGWLKQRLYP
jgi:hypothetical protein